MSGTMTHRRCSCPNGTSAETQGPRESYPRSSSRKRKVPMRRGPSRARSTHTLVHACVYACVCAREFRAGARTCAHVSPCAHVCRYCVIACLPLRVRHCVHVCVRSVTVKANVLSATAVYNIQRCRCGESVAAQVFDVTNFRPLPADITLCKAAGNVKDKQQAFCPMTVTSTSNGTYSFSNVDFPPPYARPALLPLSMAGLITDRDISHNKVCAPGSDEGRPR